MNRSIKTLCIFAALFLGGKIVCSDNNNNLGGCADVVTIVTSQEMIDNEDVDILQGINNLNQELQNIGKRIGPLSR